MLFRSQTEVFEKTMVYLQQYGLGVWDQIVEDRLGCLGDMHTCPTDGFATTIFILQRIFFLRCIMLEFLRGARSQPNWTFESDSDNESDGTESDSDPDVATTGWVPPLFPLPQARCCQRILAAEAHSANYHHLDCGNPACPRSGCNPKGDHPLNRNKASYEATTVQTHGPDAKFPGWGAVLFQVGACAYNLVWNAAIVQTIAVPELRYAASLLKNRMLPGGQ